jgi:hypothetical protein
LLLADGGYVMFHDFFDPSNQDPDHLYGVFQAVLDTIGQDVQFVIAGPLEARRFSTRCLAEGKRTHLRENPPRVDTSDACARLRDSVLCPAEPRIAILARLEAGMESCCRDAGATST